MAFSKNVRVKLEGVVLSYPHLFRKKATMEDGPEKYRANFIIDPDSKLGKKNLKRIEDALETVTDELWDKEPKIKEGRDCLFDGDDFEGDDGEVRAGYKGMMAVRATSSKRPKVVDRDGETPLTEDDDRIYGGLVVNAYIDVYATNDKKVGGNGRFATLMGVQFVRDGERFGGSAGLGDDAFDDLGDDDDEDEPPKKKKGKASKRSRDEDEDDDDDDAPKKKGKSSKRSRDEDDDDDEDEPPKKKKGKASKRSRDDEDEDDDEDEPPKRKGKGTKRRRDEEDDEDDDEDI